MKVTKSYNNIPKKLLDSTKLKKGEVVVYRLVGIQKDPSNPDRWVIPTQVNVVPQDTIYDPETNEYYQIAAIKTARGDNDPIFHDIFFTRTNGGLIELKGGVADHQEIHSYLHLCNRNASNINRDTTVERVFELVDEVKKSEVENKERNNLRDALNAAADMKPQEVRDFIASIGRDDSRDLKILRNEAEKFAQTNPTEFLKKFNNKQNVIIATLKRAQDSGSILFNTEDNIWRFATGEVITSVARSTGTNHLESLMEFCIASKKGEAVYQEIIKLSK